jgi:hypothetical protein
VFNRAAQRSDGLLPARGAEEITAWRTVTRLSTQPGATKDWPVVRARFALGAGTGFVTRITVTETMNAATVSKAATVNASV